MKLIYTIAGFLILLTFGVTILFSGKGDMQLALETKATGDLKRLSVYEEPIGVDALSMVDETGASYTLGDFNKGKVTVLNIWATWCVPCLEEMPALSRLQDQRGSDAFEVVIVSIDRKGFEAVNPWLDKMDIKNMRSFLDPKGRMQMAFDSTFMPTTIFLDKKGKAVAKIIGPALWDEQNVADVLDIITDEK